MKTKPKFNPEICSCCGQETEYLLGIDRGTTEIVKEAQEEFEQKKAASAYAKMEAEKEKEKKSKKKGALKKLLGL